MSISRTAIAATIRRNRQSIATAEPGDIYARYVSALRQGFALYRNCSDACDYRPLKTIRRFGQWLRKYRTSAIANRRHTYPTRLSTQELHSEWSGIGSNREPNPEQRRLMDVVARIVDAGAFYSADVKKQVAAELGADAVPNGLTLQDVSGAVEGGILGMEIYYARRAVDAERRRAANLAASARFAPGMILKNVLCSQGSPLSTATITEAGAACVKMTGKRRGSGRTYIASIEPATLAGCIDRGETRIAAPAPALAA